MRVYNERSCSSMFIEVDFPHLANIVGRDGSLDDDGVSVFCGAGGLTEEHSSEEEPWLMPGVIDADPPSDASHDSAFGGAVSSSEASDQLDSQSECECIHNSHTIHPQTIRERRWLSEIMTPARDPKQFELFNGNQDVVVIISGSQNLVATRW